MDHRSIVVALRRLHDLSKSIYASLDPTEVESTVVETAASLMHADKALLLVFDEASCTLRVHSSLGIDVSKTGRLQFRDVRPFDHCLVHKGSVIALEEVLSEADLESCRSHMPELLRMLFAPLETHGAIHGLLGVSDSGRCVSMVELEVFCSLASQAAAAIENASLYEKLHKTFMHTTEALVEAVDSRDPYTGGHARRVVTYALMIADAMQLDGASRATLQMAAMLHDIGKIGIEDAVLRKAARLTDKETAAMDGHPEIGARILCHVGEMSGVIPGVRHHHERFDGTGYPDHLAGDAIPLEARIIAVADVYDALTTDRPYRRALHAEQAIAKMREGRGTQFDPAILDVFVALSAVRQDDAHASEVNESVTTRGSQYRGSPEVR